MRVRLIPTGQMELLALATCLRRAFPDHDFETVSARDEPDGGRVPFDGFTSGRLHPDLAPDALRRLVEQLAAEVHPGRSGNPADLAVIVDDLELENIDRVPIVAAVVRAAVRAHLRDAEQRRGSVYADKVAEALRGRASFHLAVPMIEAWLFGDEAALRAARVPEERLPARLAEGCDPERFMTDDAAFSADDGASCEKLRQRNARGRKTDVPRWVLSPRPAIPGWRREGHPKAYLSWLCRDPNHERCTAYRESEGGASGLAAMRWPVVLGSPNHFAWARALILDVANALDASIPAYVSNGIRAEMPGGSGGDLVLRNL